MIRKVLTVVVLVIGGLTQSVSADEGTKEESVPVGMVGEALIATEGAIWLSAYAISLNPKVFGVDYAVWIPLVAAMVSVDGNANTTFWVSAATLEALALYNIKLDENKMSRNEKIRANFIGLNAWLIITSLTWYFTGDYDKDKDKKIVLNYMPEPQGGRLILSYRF